MVELAELICPMVECGDLVESVRMLGDDHWLSMLEMNPEMWNELETATLDAG